MSAQIYLHNPKYAHNVGGTLRAAACLGADVLRWSGERVSEDGDYKRVAKTSARLPTDKRKTKSKKWRLPREERIKDYQSVDWAQLQGDEQYTWITDRVAEGFTPVCIEVLENSENLVDFDHPDDAVYVFGPEDGDVPRGVRNVCHRFVTIPSIGCLNLANAVNITLYDRLAKETAMMQESAYEKACRLVGV